MKVIGWTSMLLLALGQILPWTHQSRPASEAWDWMFSRVSNPNLEWWVWFLAPVAAMILSARGLLRNGGIPRAALVPAIMFFLVWVALFLTGIRAYLSFSQPGFLLTFAGLIIMTVLALRSAAAAKQKETLGSRRATRPTGR